LLKSGAPIAAAKQTKGPPSKPAGPFTIFCRDERDKRKRERGVLTPADTHAEIKMLSHRWQLLSQEDKAFYARAALAEFEQKCAEVADDGVGTIADSYSPGNSLWGLSDATSPLKLSVFEDAVRRALGISGEQDCINANHVSSS
jgi:hypothetical protein